VFLGTPSFVVALNAVMGDETAIVSERDLSEHKRPSMRIVGIKPPGISEETDAPESKYIRRSK
jgi:hypothetical protein